MFHENTRRRKRVKRLSHEKLRRAVTLVEILLVVAVLGVLLAISVGGLSATRRAAQATRKLSEMGQIGAAVQGYASWNRDLPPVVVPKPAAWPETLQTITVNGTAFKATWFANGELFYTLIDPLLPARMLRGGAAESHIVETPAGETVDWSPYQLTHTLFAGVDYWVPARQRPLTAWGPQTFDGVAVPSQKGMIVHPHYVDPAQYADGSPQVSNGKQYGPEGVCWFDLSASTPKANELKPGIANRFRWGVNGIVLNEYDTGPAILNTYLGLSGMDR